MRGGERARERARARKRESARARASESERERERARESERPLELSSKLDTRLVTYLGSAHALLGTFPALATSPTVLPAVISAVSSANVFLCAGPASAAGGGALRPCSRSSAASSAAACASISPTVLGAPAAGGWLGGAEVCPGSDFLVKLLNESAEGGRRPTLVVPGFCCMGNGCRLIADTYWSCSPLRTPSVRSMSACRSAARACGHSHRQRLCPGACTCNTGAARPPFAAQCCTHTRTRNTDEE
jgi:hypothetical protein